MRNPSLTLFKAAILALLIWQTPKWCHAATDGFTLPKIRSTLSYSPQFDTSLPSAKTLEPILDQPYTYLKAGGQSYVFASEDGRYVLKFFKHYRMRLHPLFEWLPLWGKWEGLREKQRQKRARKLMRDFTSYKLSHDLLKRETALVCVHLNKGRATDLRATLVDKLGITHRLNLEEYEFVIQRRAELAYPYFKRLAKAGQLEEAKEALDSFCGLIEKRCGMGIFDEDAKVHRNVGFIDKEAIIIDVGRLKEDPSRRDPSVQAQDLKKIATPLIEYLEPLSGELASHLRIRCEER